MAPRAWPAADTRPFVSADDAMMILSIARGCLSCSSEAAFRSLFAKVRALLPLHRAYAILGRLDARRRLVVARCINIGFPEEFVREYAERRYFQHDPPLRRAFEIGGVMLCRDATPGRPKRISSLCREFGLGGTSIHGVRPRAPNTNGGVFVFHAPSAVQDRRAVAVLDLVVPHLQLALSRVVEEGSEGAEPAALSPREREVARWLMAGKSSWEIAVILGISERTVTFHVCNLLRKLGATNRTQAVAIAARWGLAD